MARKQKKSSKHPEIVWKFMGDGVWEIALGVAVIWAGVITLLRWSILWFLAAIGLGLVVYFLKKTFIFPLYKKIKIPYVKSRNTIELIILAIIILFGLLSIFKQEPGWMGYWNYLQENTFIMVATFSAIISFFIAYTSLNPRFYLHGILLFMTYFLEATFFVENPLGLSIGAGIVMLISGIVAFRQFLQQKNK